MATAVGQPINIMINSGAAAIFYYNDISEGKLTKMYQKYAFLYESNVSVISV